MNFPKTLYVKIDGDKEVQYFDASARLDDLVEDDPTLIAAYTLVTQDKYKKHVVQVKRRKL